VTWVIDASVALKWFIEEDGSRQAASLLDQPERLIAPDLIIAEVCNAGWKSVRSGQMTPAQHDHMAARVALAFDTLAPLNGLARAASRIGRSLDHPIYDCFYLALADQTDARLVTADQRLIRRLAGSAWTEQIVYLRNIPTGR